MHNHCKIIIKCLFCKTLLIFDILIFSLYDDVEDLKCKLISLLFEIMYWIISKIINII